MQIKVTNNQLMTMHCLKGPSVGVHVRFVSGQFIQTTRTVTVIFVGNHLACTHVNACVNANGAVVTRQLKAYNAIRERAMVCSLHFDMW